MSPYFPGHDSWGYRNKRVPDRCEVLAIGDSLTYGFAAPPDGSWPRQLEKLSGKVTYNGGVGGYGPCEYTGVLNELLVLKPATVLLGLYLGNDISDAYKTVYLDRRCSYLQSRDPRILNDIKEADEKVTLREFAERYGMVASSANAYENGSFSMRQWLGRYSSLYGLGRSVLFFLTERGVFWRDDSDYSFTVAAKKPFRLAFDALPQFRTVFRHPELDALAVNLEDPRIREGLRITQVVLLSIHTELQKLGIRFIVVLLHNKPYVYSDILLKYQPSLSQAFSDLVEQEERMTQVVVEFLRNNDISYVETLPAIRSRFYQVAPPYPESDDHHPNETGYLAIADSILPRLEYQRPD